MISNDDVNIACSTVKSEPSCTSLEWTPMTPYKPEMTLQMPSPVNRSLRERKMMMMASKDDDNKHKYAANNAEEEA
jgi:hypothetical protein